MAAVNAKDLVGCLHCVKKSKGRWVSTSYTLFMHWHPFKEGWEVRKCVTCGKLTAQDSRS
jgi:hypothetical protein